MITATEAAPVTASKNDDQTGHVVVIAEIGINHNGDMDIAKRLIDGAALAGADAVKFQKRHPDSCVPEAQKGKLRDTPWGTMTYLDYKKRMEFDKAEYDEIDAYCRDKGIEWFASAWDIGSQMFLRGYDSRYNKICSAMLGNIELLEAVAEEGKYTYISTGMSELHEVDEAVAVFERHDCPICVMHCNSSYPALTSELNLNVITTLKERYQVDVGYSGHEFGLTPSYVAVVLGACAVERHITLNRTMWGTDQMASVEVPAFFKLVGQIRSIRSALGDGVKRITESERPIREKLRGS